MGIRFYTVWTKPPPPTPLPPPHPTPTPKSLAPRLLPEVHLSSPGLTSRAINSAGNAVSLSPGRESWGCRGMAGQAGPNQATINSSGAGDGGTARERMSSRSLAWKEKGGGPALGRAVYFSARPVISEKV